MPELTPPADGVAANLVTAGRMLDTLTTNKPVAVAQATIGAAQVYATFALVHAVRDLTDAVRALQEAE